MPRIPDEIVERVKREISLVHLAERAGVELKKVGHELTGRCPFPPHEDSTPSFSINPERNVFQCFGCGAAGTSIDWTMREKGVEFREAVEILLGEFFPDAVGEVLGQAARQLTRRSRGPELPCPFDFTGDDQQLLNEYVDQCQALFRDSTEPQDYLSKRGIDDAELVSRFKLGYQDRTLGLRLPTGTTKGGREVRERFQKLGLIRESGHASFVGSLIVPTIDLARNVTGIYARKTRDDLNKNHASPKHLYLSGPDRDVFNEEAFVSSKEIVLCEARIDALSFWRWGIRNVTACRGAKNLSEALFDAFTRYGVERCYIAFDHDEAGDKGAAAAAQTLIGAGIECFRVRFPKTMDANEVSLKMTPADETLALFVRSAEWMGGGRRPPRARLAPHASMRDATPDTSSFQGHEAQPAHPSAARAATHVELEPRASEAATSPSEATEEERPLSCADELERGTLRAAEEGKSSKSARQADSASPTIRFAQHEPASGATVTNVEPAVALVAPAAPPPNSTTSPAVPAAMPPGLVKLDEDEAELLFDDRRYRARGLRKCGAYGSLRINLKAEREGDFFAPPSPIAGWHMDNLDLCVHRARQLFEGQASHELGVKEELIRLDLGRIVKVLEAVQEQRIAESRAPKVKLVTLTDKETEEAIAFWKSPDLFARIAEDYTKCGLVGELVNKIATYVAATSRLLDRPLAIIVQSSSAAGKSTLMDRTLAFMPEEMREKYTAVSGKSLFYMDEGTVLKHKILAIVEEEGAERATYPLKILQSEGELVMASTGKDPHSGKLVTKIYRVEGPVMIILTTTSVEIDPELENRCLRLTVDESREQTRAIHELQRMRMTYEGHLLQAERERIQKLHQNAQRLLRRLRVHNPYAHLLTFVSDQTRTRRDHDKYLTLIETIALMQQFQRPIYRREVGGVAEEYIDVTLSDIELAGQLVGDILGQLLDDLPPQTRTFLNVLDHVVSGLCEKTGVERCDLRFTRRQIRELTGWHDTQIRLHMARLIELEHVLIHKGSRGHSFVYELLYAGEGQEGKPYVLGLLDTSRLRQQEGQSASTTSGSRGEEGRIAGGSRGHRGPIAGAVRGEASAPEPAREAALVDPEQRCDENALIPTRPETGSSSPVVPTKGNGNGHGRLVRINLLRRSAVSLELARNTRSETLARGILAGV